MVDLTIGVNTFSCTGTSDEYTVTSSGTITVDMWGAAGGGGLLINQPGYGGAGALVQFELDVNGGDVIKIEVGGGGKKAPNPAPGNGGLGGWPDGGAGGAYAPLASSFGCSGGGGSTRIYLNNVLVAVAAAGGGGLYSAANNGRSGGHGGSTVGGIDERGFLAAATTTQGGYHAAATYLTTPSKVRGASLAGGNGWAHSDIDGQVDNASSPTEYTGCGGGGGYYGGAGGVAGERQFPSGGGGTSYVDTGAVNTSAVTAAFWYTPPDTATRPSGVAVGGTSGNGTQTDGGDGYVWLNFESDAISADAEGLIGTVTMTAPAGVGTGDINIDVEIDTVVMSAVEGSAEAVIPIFGELPTITVICGIVAGPIIQANITVDLLFELEPPVITYEGTDSATGAAEVPGEERPDLVIGSVAVGAVTGYYQSEDQDTEVEIGTVTLVPMEGYAAQALASPDLPHTSGTVPPEATATGASYVAAPISFIPEGGFGGGIGLTAPEGIPYTSDMESFGDIGKIIVEPIIGVGLSGDDIVLAVGQEIPAVFTSVIDGEAGGEALAVAILNHYDDTPSERYLVRVSTAPIVATATGAALKDAPIDLTITFSVPVALTERGQTVLAPIGVVFVQRPLGGAGDEPNIEGDALAGLDMPTITVVPVEATYQIDGEATGALGLVLVLPPPVEAWVGQDFPLNIPGPITLTAPEGAAYPVDPASTALADLTAVVVLTVPQAAVSAAVEAALPGPVVISPVVTFVRVVSILGQAVIEPVILGTAILRRVENGVAVVEDRIEQTVVVRG